MGQAVAGGFWKGKELEAGISSGKRCDACGEVGDPVCCNPAGQAVAGE
ncbi:MAG: hypothetical protein JXA90_11350 [Planctomycetes bacterium]|nr:hypothetical protein [Planctomycetota bacterium]